MGNQDYIEIPKEQAYMLMTPGPVILVSTVNCDGRADIAPVAWSSPLDYSDTTRVLFVLDPGHATADNIRQTGVFAICIPHRSQVSLVMKTGSASGRDTDKFSAFDIASTIAHTSGCRIPDGIVGWIECMLNHIHDENGSIIVTGSAKVSFVNRLAWNGNVLPDKEEGKTLHYLGNGRFASLAPINS